MNYNAIYTTKTLHLFHVNRTLGQTCLILTLSNFREKRSKILEVGIDRCSENLCFEVNQSSWFSIQKIFNKVVFKNFDQSQTTISLKICC